MFERRWRIWRLPWWTNIELLPTPFLHTLHGYLLGLTVRWARALRTSILVLDMLTRSSFASKLSFQAVKWFSSPSKDSCIITKSSAYSSSHRFDSLRIMPPSQSQTAKNSELNPGEFPPWGHFSLQVLFIRTLDAALAFIVWTNQIFHSSILSFCITHQTTFLGTMSKAFSRSPKAK